MVFFRQLLMSSPSLKRTSLVKPNATCFKCSVTTSSSSSSFSSVRRRQWAQATTMGSKTYTVGHKMLHDYLYDFLHFCCRTITIFLYVFNYSIVRLKFYSTHSIHEELRFRWCCNRRAFATFSYVATAVSWVAMETYVMSEEWGSDRKGWGCGDEGLIGRVWRGKGGYQ